MGDQLLVLDFASDSVGHLLRRDSGERIRSFGRRGTGMGAFRGAWSVVDRPHDTVPYIFDLTARSLRPVRSGVSPAEIKLASPGTLTDVAFIDDTLIVAPVQSAAHRLAFFGRDGNLLRFAGKLPTEIEGVALQAQQQSYQSTLVMAPGRARFVLLNRFAGRGQIYGRDGELVDTIEAPIPFDPQYKEERGRMKTLPETRFGYIAGTATDSLIFALFSGRDGHGDAPVSSGSVVHVFDWSGRFVKGYQLDADAIAIATDPSGLQMYAARPSPRPAIVRYDLPKIPSANVAR